MVLAWLASSLCAVPDQCQAALDSWCLKCGSRHALKAAGAASVACGCAFQVSGFEISTRAKQRGSG